MPNRFAAKRFNTKDGLNRLALRHQDAAGLAGSLSWVEENKDDGIVGKALGEVLDVLRSKTPPESSEKWCGYVRMREDLL